MISFYFFLFEQETTWVRTFSLPTEQHLGYWAIKIPSCTMGRMNSRFLLMLGKAVKSSVFIVAHSCQFARTDPWTQEWHGIFHWYSNKEIYLHNNFSSWKEISNGYKFLICDFLERTMGMKFSNPTESQTYKTLRHLNIRTDCC